MRVLPENKSHRLHEPSNNQSAEKQPIPEASQQEVDSFEKRKEVSSEYTYISWDSPLEKDARIEIVLRERHSNIWWNDLADLTNCLPSATVSATNKTVCLDDSTKEVLRFLAKSSPHLRLTL